MIRIALVLVLLSFSSSALAKSIHTDLCAVSDPRTRLPPDPRALATRANGYTSSWQNCHPEGNPFPTCGEWLDAVARGGEILKTRALIGSIWTAEDYDNLWKAWGRSEPPDRGEFEERIVDRYGLQRAPFDNPYPRSDGMTGQLPMGLIQTRGADGNYDGGVGVTCLVCHATRIGDESDVVGGTKLGSWIGLGDNTFDLELFQQDMAKAGATPLPLPYSHNQTRGTINAVSDFEFLMTVRDFDTLDRSPFVKALPAHAAPGDQDPPNWWNTGSRPRVYMDGGVSSDNTRALMQFLTAEVSKDGEWIMAQEADFEAIRVYVDSLQPPPFPGPIDTTCTPADRVCAAEGERIFHRKDLFARDHKTAPFGNGSCSSCHGVYSANHLDLLPDPRLLGIAGQIVPKDVIGTDPGRVDTLSEDLRWGWGTLWFAYPDLAEGYAPAENQLIEWLNDYNSKRTNYIAGGRVQGICGWEERQIGYAAPPLHGIWASAPYFHNGSVPTVRGVLDPLDPLARPTFWRRQLTGEKGGFDTSLEAYDFANLGWRHDVLRDSDMPLSNAVTDLVLDLQGGILWPAEQSPRPLTEDDVERRKIYDTHLYGKSNRGHYFTYVLSPDERRALIEYLKTL